MSSAHALVAGTSGWAGGSQIVDVGIGLAIGVEWFPWATLLVNVTGSFALAFVLTFATERQLSPELSTAVTVGFIGAYTTFSTFAWETFALGRTGRAATAAIYVAVSLAGGLAAAWGGYRLARLAG